MRFYSFLAFLLALSGCNSPNYQAKTADYSLVAVDSIVEDSAAAALIAPYAQKMQSFLQDTLCYLAVPMHNGRTTDVSQKALWDWTSQAALQGWRSNGYKADGCLLNRGGLRTSWEPGWLLVEDVYEMMPFENRLVVVYLTKTQQKDLANYLQIEKHPMIFPDQWGDTLAVLTTDYLANGGDDMDFFVGQPRQSSNLLLREILMEQARIDTLKPTPL